MIRYALFIPGFLLCATHATADPSLECSLTVSSQVETAACLGEVAESVNAAMDAALKFATDSAAELDEITGRDTAVSALDASQKAWLTFRDTECTYAGALFGGGSGTGIAIQSCQIELTRARTSALIGRIP